MEKAGSETMAALWGLGLDEAGQHRAVTEAIPNVMRDGDDAIVTRCKDGWLVTVTAGAGALCLLATYFIGEDGHIVQLSVAGRDDMADAERMRGLAPGWEPLRVCAYDGIDGEDPAAVTFVRG